MTTTDLPSVAVPHLVKVAADGGHPVGTILGPGAHDIWVPGANWDGEWVPEGWMLYPHGEETPEGPLRELFGERFPDLRAQTTEEEGS